MSSWRISAWTHPADAGGFDLREHSIPALRFTMNDPEEPRGRCTITVPATYDWKRLISVPNPTDPSDTSLIRLYREGIDNTGEPDVEWMLERFQKRISDDGVATVELFGVDWRVAGLDAAVIRWQDWEPGNTITRQADWSFGGDDQQNLLENITFDKGGVSEKVEYHVHAVSGFYTITVPTFGTTGNLSPYENGGRASDVKTALELLGGIENVSVTGRGHTQFDPLVIEFRDPQTDIGTVTINDVSLINAGCDHPPCHDPQRSVLQEGGFDPEPWTGCRTPKKLYLVPQLHGTYFPPDVEVVVDPDLGAPDYVLKINGASAKAGAQQIIEEVENGLFANASVEIYSSSTTNSFQINIVDNRENLIASSTLATVPANTWTEFTIANFTLPDPTLGGRIAFRVQVSSGNAAPAAFHIRKPFIAYGQAASTIGVIQDQMLDDAKTDHSPTLVRIPWVDKGAWTNTLDSDGNTWDRAEHLILRRGQKYGTHIAGGQFANLGYEYDLTPNGATAVWDWETYNTGGRGTVLSGIAFVVGMGVAGGLVAGRLPKATRWLAEGEGGLITESVNTAQETATGVVEEYFGDPDILDASTLLGKASHFLTTDIANRVALTAELDDSAPTPYADFNVGDTVEFQVAGTLDKHDRRVSEIGLRATTDAGGELIWTPTVTASKLFIGEAARNEAIYRLLRASPRFPRKPSSRAGGLDALGGTPTYVVAASDASVASQNAAHYVCNGADDQVQIQAALVALPSGAGRVLLTEGTFKVANASDIFVTAGATLEGLNARGTIILQTGTGTAGGGAALVEMQGGARVANLTILSTVNDVGGIDASTGSAPGWIENCIVDVEERGITLTASGITVTGCEIDSNDDVGIFIEGSDHVIVGNDIFGDLFCIDQTSSTRDNNYIAGNTLVGGFDGVRLRAGSHNVVTGNYISAGGSGLILDGTDDTAITDNYFDSTNIELTDGDNNRIIGNWIGGDEHGIDIAHGTSGVVNGLLISGNRILGGSATAAIRMAAGASTTVADVTITGNQISGGDFGIDIDKDTVTGVAVTGNNFSDHATAAIHGDGPAAVTITGNTIRNCPATGTGAAIHFEYGTPSTGGRNLIISDNNIEGDTEDGSGIEVTDYLYYSVANNVIHKPNRHGIVITDSSDGHVTGNLITEPGASTDDTYDGIILAGDSDRNDIWDNKIIGASGSPQPRYAINISASTCDDNSYLGNRAGPASDYGQANPYNDAGTGTVNTWPGASAPQGDNLL